MELKSNNFIESPIFVIGCPRSGTTLLRLILNSHSKISIPHEFFLVEKVIEKFNCIENINKKDALDFIFSLKKYKHYQDWDLNEKDLILNIRNHSGLTKNKLIQLVYLEYLKTQTGSKIIWGDKNIGSLSFIEEIIEIFPKAKFIHIVRDGRDVASSLKKVKWNFYKFPNLKYRYVNNIKGTALTWNDGLSLISKNKNNFNKNNFFELKYEDLLVSPESIIHNLCNYINVSFEIEMLEFYKPKKGKEISSERLKNTHENTQRPILKNNFNKYLNNYSKNEIAIFERFTKENLLKYNYSTNEYLFKISNTLFLLNNAKYFFQHNINLLILNFKIVIKRIINR